MNGTASKTKNNIYMVMACIMAIAMFAGMVTTVVAGRQAVIHWASETVGPEIGQVLPFFLASVLILLTFLFLALGISSEHQQQQGRSKSGQAQP